MSNVFNDGEPMIAVAVSPTEKPKSRKTRSKPRGEVLTQPDVTPTPTPVMRAVIGSDRYGLTITDNRIRLSAVLKQNRSVTVFTGDNVCVNRTVAHYGAELNDTGVIIDPSCRALIPFGGSIYIPDGYNASVKIAAVNGLTHSLQIVDVDDDAMIAYLKAGVVPVVNLSDVRTFIRDAQVIGSVDMVKRSPFSIGTKFN